MCYSTVLHSMVRPQPHERYAARKKRRGLAANPQTIAPATSPATTTEETGVRVGPRAGIPPGAGEGGHSHTCF